MKDITPIEIIDQIDEQHYIDRYGVDLFITDSDFQTVKKTVLTASEIYELKRKLTELRNNLLDKLESNLIEIEKDCTRERTEIIQLINKMDKQVERIGLVKNKLKEALGGGVIPDFALEIKDTLERAEQVENNFKHLRRRVEGLQVVDATQQIKEISRDLDYLIDRYIETISLVKGYLNTLYHIDPEVDPLRRDPEEYYQIVRGLPRATQRGSERATTRARTRSN